MAKAKFRSFTKYVEERRKDSPSFEFMGETYNLAPSLPYDAVLRFQALSERDQTDELSVDDIMGIFESVVGKKTVEQLRKHGEFDIDVMTEIIKFVFEAYGISEPTEEVEQDTENPKAKKKAQQ